MKNKPIQIITHHAVSAKHHTHLDVGQWHLERWNGYQPSRIRQDVARYAGYHYIVNYDGTWEQCRALDEEGIHCRGQNLNSVSVCFMGNNNKHMPPQAEKKAWREVYADIKKQGYDIPASEIYPHRKYSDTDCHGTLLSDTYWQEQLQNETWRERMLRELQGIKDRLLSLLDMLQ